MKYLNDWNTRRQADTARAIRAAMFTDQVVVKVIFQDGRQEDVFINPGGEVVIDLREIMATGTVKASPASSG